MYYCTGKVLYYLRPPLKRVIAAVPTVPAHGAGHVLHPDSKGGDELLHKVERVRGDGSVAYGHPVIYIGKKALKICQKWLNMCVQIF
jgi:hypothetical protein